MNMSRRKFVGGAAVGLLGIDGLSAAEETQSQPKFGVIPGEMPLVISTWSFGEAANEEALKVLLAGGSRLDAVEQGIHVTETDDQGHHSVGLGGKPNAAGVVQLDACIMDGPGHRAGSVAALEGIRHPISVARRVMEKTKHVMLAGEGARLFALEQGLESVEIESHEIYEKWRKEREKPAQSKPDNHDTIAMLVLAADGTIAGGCSTSGLAGKLPGRVGDSPIIGSGLYVDSEVGAAGATGVGENVMRYCGSFMIVEHMRQGMNPTEACQEAIRRIARMDPKGFDLSINFIALDKHGRFGAAGTDKSFQFAVATRTSSKLLDNPGLGNAGGAK
jgi:N4-(beta-N-acetylglucosaminyl)-L-asparaginase